MHKNWHATTTLLHEDGGVRRERAKTYENSWNFAVSASSSQLQAGSDLRPSSPSPPSGSSGFIRLMHSRDERASVKELPRDIMFKKHVFLLMFELQREGGALQ